MLSQLHEIYGAEFPLVNRYVDILASTGVDWGLIGPREAERLWDRHILNSAALSGLIATNSAVADVGSGAGLPGIPLALLRSDLEMTLIEPLLRRSAFLTETIETLGIADRVRVVRSRAEDHQQVTGPDHRDRLGKSARDEVAAAQRQLTAARLAAEVLSVQAHPDAEPATVVRISAKRRNPR